MRSKRRDPAVPLMILLLFFIVPAPAGAGDAAAELFRAPGPADPAVRLVPPPHWSRLTFPGVAGALVSPPDGPEDRFDENVTLVVADAEGSLERYTRDALAALDAVPGSAVLQAGPARLAGLPAHRVSFTGRLGGLRMRWLQVWTLKAGKAYVLTYSAEEARYPDGLRAVERALASFEILAEQTKKEGVR